MQVTSSRVNQHNHTVSHADSGFPDSWAGLQWQQKKRNKLDAASVCCFYGARMASLSLQAQIG